MQEEVDQKTIALAVKTGKLTAQVLQAAIRKYLAARQKGTGKAHHGQQSLRQLKKLRGLENFSTHFLNR